MDNLITEINNKMKDVIDNLETIKNEYSNKINNNEENIKNELEKVKKYKDDFFESKSKIEKMNADIEGFESDYNSLVERFKDDELANILIAANKEISSKIEERKRKIIQDKKAMNELVSQAEIAKEKLVKLNAEKKALELCMERIEDAYNYYSKSILDIIDYSENHRDKLCFDEEETDIDENEENIVDDKNIEIDDEKENIIDEEELNIGSFKFEDEDEEPVIVENKEQLVEEEPVIEDKKVENLEKEEKNDIEQPIFTFEPTFDNSSIEISEDLFSSDDEEVKDSESEYKPEHFNFDGEIDLSSFINFDDNLDK